MAYETIVAQTHGDVGLITLNRPDALNALSSQMLNEIVRVISDYESDNKIGAIVICGSEKAFAAGADVKEMAQLSYIDAFLENFLDPWEQVTKCRKPLIAAVSGYALGGGCELALMCDFILATETARFGLPEITLGIMPGMGGTQRLARSIGKAKAMEMVLTGRMMDAQEAERCGLVSRIIPADELVDEALKTAKKIAEFSRPITMMAKESVNRSFETSLSEGLRFERRVFHSMFATDDQKEGMAAFIDKRKAQFKDK